MSTVNANSLDFGELEHLELTAALDDLEGEVQAAVDWMDDAFGEIEAELGRLAPIRAAKAAFRMLLRR